MNNCKTCLFYNREYGGFGSCESTKFLTGYGLSAAALSDGEVLVEDDEGWAFYVSDDFGCVHHEEIING